MDLKQIEKLMAAMERSSIKKVVLKREGFEIELERECATDASLPFSEPSHGLQHPIVCHEQERTQSENSASGIFVTSPMVGTFYSASSPDDPLYAKVGDIVQEETVLCIIEAMKVMNEVKAGVRGRVVEVLVKNGDPVEFGSNIFRIEP